MIGRGQHVLHLSRSNPSAELFGLQEVTRSIICHGGTEFRLTC